MNISCFTSCQNSRYVLYNMFGNFHMELNYYNKSGIYLCTSMYKVVTWGQGTWKYYMIYYIFSWRGRYLGMNWCRNSLVKCVAPRPSSFILAPGHHRWTLSTLGSNMYNWEFWQGVKHVRIYLPFMGGHLLCQVTAVYLSFLMSASVEWNQLAYVKGNGSNTSYGGFMRKLRIILNKCRQIWVSQSSQRREFMGICSVAWIVRKQEIKQIWKCYNIMCGQSLLDCIRGLDPRKWQGLLYSCNSVKHLLTTYKSISHKLLL